MKTAKRKPLPTAAKRLRFTTDDAINLHHQMFGEVIERLDTLEESVQRADNYATAAFKKAESWESTLRDHSKTVGLMDAWRKELERRIGEVDARTPSAAPSSLHAKQQRLEDVLHRFVVDIKDVLGVDFIIACNEDTHFGD
jgi:hypothetical protein